MSLVKTGSGTWNLSGSNTYTGTTTVNGGLLTVSGTAGSLGQSSHRDRRRRTLQLDDSAPFEQLCQQPLGQPTDRVARRRLSVNLGNTSGGTETIGAVTATMGENTLALAASAGYPLAGGGWLSGGSLAPMAGATLNFTGHLSGTNGMAFSGMSSGSNFIDAGTFVNGADYAVYDAGGYVRAMVVGGNAWDYALNSVSSARHVLLTSAATSQPSVSLLTLSLSGAGSGFRWPTARRSPSRPAGSSRRAAARPRSEAERGSARRANMSSAPTPGRPARHQHAARRRHGADQIRPRHARARRLGQHLRRPDDHRRRHADNRGCRRHSRHVTAGHRRARDPRS